MPRSFRKETLLGNWISDRIRKFANADAAFHNSGGIRASLPAGAVKVRDIFEVVPFGNTVVKMQLTGQTERT